jgi:hypothetical protein
MKTSKYTIYARSTGMEITPYEKRQEGKPREGRISLRFFRMEGGAPQLRFVAEPWEGFELSRMIEYVSREGGKQTLTHKFEGSSGEIVTKLSVEKYARNGKEGHALAIQRGEEVINVPAPLGQFLYTGEFLRSLSVSEAWVQQCEADRGGNAAD